MNKIVEDYLVKLDQKELSNRDAFLIENGFFEKVYSETNEYSSEFPFNDNEQDKFFKKIAIEVTDDEYKKIYNSLEHKEKNSVSTLIFIIAIIIYIGGFLAGASLANAPSEYYGNTFNISVAIIYWAFAFICGSILLGLSEIIKLLHKIANK